MRNLLHPNIEYFLRIAEFDSFREAAQKIGLTQAALSQAIQRLEEDLGFRIFDRSRRGVKLTANGQALLDLAKKVKSQLGDELRLKIEHPRPASTRIGAVSYFGEKYLMPILPQFSKPNSKFLLQCFFGRSFEVYKAVEEGALDFGFVSWTRKPDTLKYVELWPDPVAVVGLRKRFAHIANALTLEDLESEPWIHFPKFQREWDHFFDAQQIAYVAKETSAFRKLILAGQAIGANQLDVFSRSELKRLAIARGPLRAEKLSIYIVYRSKPRTHVTECIEALSSALREAKVSLG